ncbi:MAG: helix-turn-helix domain-containing protein [Bacteroides sp.]|nr:helix-turn-helix domain-containing protein [Bacillota bacterium]MCM1393276.1 helix-turn-helix domain-containing protein [[Eubacterium] siraeum]MCM1455421.1 helix-turn-helix domain-containing protein [Bacteroides sp.]
MKILLVERLKELLKIYNITQYGLAKQIGISPSAICNWLNGKKEPSIESLWKLSDFFDVSIDYLVGKKEI